MGWKFTLFMTLDTGSHRWSHLSGFRHGQLGYFAVHYWLPEIDRSSPAICWLPVPTRHSPFLACCELYLLLILDFNGD
jgi:hypothetical protein